MNTDTVMCACTLQEFTAGCNKIYVRALFLLRFFTASYSLGLDQTRQDRVVGWHLCICELGSQSVCLWGWEGDGGLYLYLWSPSGPWGAGRAAAETEWGSGFVNWHQSLSSVNPITPNLWPCPNLSWPGLQAFLDGDWLSERSSWETVETVIWPVMPLCLRRMELLLLQTNANYFGSSWLSSLFLSFLMLMSIISVLLLLCW